MANNPNRLAGMATLTIDGQGYMLVSDLEWCPSSVSRETLVGMDTVHGYSEKPQQGHISGTLRDASNLSVASVNGMSNVTVIAELANGKTIIGRNMWAIETQVVKSADATIEVKFEGPQVCVTEN